MFLNIHQYHIQLLSVVRYLQLIFFSYFQQIFVDIIHSSTIQIKIERKIWGEKKEKTIIKNFFLNFTEKTQQEIKMKANKNLIK